VAVADPQTQFINHWRMPGNPTEANRNFWYSYDDGMVHVVFFTGPDEPGGFYGEDSGPFGTYKNEQIEWVT
jgi:hypothetical protein